MAAPAIGYALILHLELPAAAGAFGGLTSAIGDARAVATAAAAAESGLSCRAPAVTEGEELTATV